MNINRKNKYGRIVNVIFSNKNNNFYDTKLALNTHIITKYILPEPQLTRQSDKTPSYQLPVSLQNKHQLTLWVNMWDSRESLKHLLKMYACNKQATHIVLECRKTYPTM